MIDYLIEILRLLTIIFFMIMLILKCGDEAEKINGRLDRIEKCITEAGYYGAWKEWQEFEVY